MTDPLKSCCGNCTFGKNTSGETPDPKEKWIDCHRLPPVANHGWPKVKQAEWCGEWRSLTGDKA